ncbi:mitotic-spindle organizing protein 2 isoform X1 [Callorhinchus milii]|uniref:Mitotic-spindle organizing protein 2A-like protein n=1 Tax=Callorhinchus milii TaxID=7868 RepID=V9KRP3_CALMI|nr:mitotic-spindle organizing protein 2 isoform X1 [Callorhinchus milii]|eukprot:gi/632979809/ref/XP_007906678.1/ PREDICTED: mitotic-spindle organizing protein 2B-like isoform X1 [Callorhinchus milii]
MAMPQQAGVSGLDGQQNLLATVSGNVQKYAAKKKKVLTAEEMELYELTQAAGIVMDQEVFKIIVDLLKMNVAPLAVFQMLKAMCAGHSIAEMSSAEAVSTMTRSNLADSREHSFISAKNSKIPALSFSSALRPPRLATKMVVYNPADACSPLSQGPPGSFQFSCCLFSPFSVRNKSNAAISGSQLQTERSSSREGSSQRVPRQPSATRAPKGSSTGKNTAGGSSTQPQSGL